jgi:hypothetical protein
MVMATRSSWKNLPPPAHREALGLTANFTDAEFEVIKDGVVPKEMEDKWFIFMKVIGSISIAVGRGHRYMALKFVIPTLAGRYRNHE